MSKFNIHACKRLDVSRRCAAEFGIAYSHDVAGGIAYIGATPTNWAKMLERYAVLVLDADGQVEAICPDCKSEFIRTSRSSGYCDTCHAKHAARVRNAFVGHG